MDSSESFLISHPINFEMRCLGGVDVGGAHIQGSSHLAHRPAFDFDFDNAQVAWAERLPIFQEISIGYLRATGPNPPESELATKITKSTKGDCSARARVMKSAAFRSISIPSPHFTAQGSPGKTPDPRAYQRQTASALWWR